MANRRFVFAFAPIVVASSLLAAGCGGGGSSPSVANTGPATSTSATAAQPSLVAFAHCMRAHGVSGFPGPASDGNIPKELVVAARARNETKFNAASAACANLLPNGSLGTPETAQQKRTQLADELSFARCMRQHGLSRFPDPTSEGGLSVEMVEADGIDVHSTAVLHIAQTCIPASHGGLTMKKIRESINGNG
ncbi:MAG TPA: hypothetical protein VFA97_02950 [Gaiellaceae bacterium]|nr:hypothetical protein [Gaiellaceae bacterium]